MNAAGQKHYRVVRANLNTQIYDILKEMIADRRFDPGSFINVEKLTQELDVSRTPIWEAVRRLEQEGIVVHTPHKGVQVSRLTQKMALELYVVREVLECLAARLAAPRATPKSVAEMETCLREQLKIVAAGDAVAYSRSDHQFHLLIYQLCDNELLYDMLSGLRYRARSLAFKLTPHLTQFYEYHEQILEAFRRRDSEAAEDAIRRHNRRMVELIRLADWKE